MSVILWKQLLLFNCKDLGVTKGNGRFLPGREHCKLAPSWQCFCGGGWLHLITIAKVLERKEWEPPGEEFLILPQGTNNSITAHYRNANCWNVGVNSFSASFAWAKGVFKVRIAQFNIPLRLSTLFSHFPFVFPRGTCQQLRRAGVRLVLWGTRQQLPQWKHEGVNVTFCVSKSLNELLAFVTIWLSGCDLRTSRYCFWSGKRLPEN